MTRRRLLLLVCLLGVLALLVWTEPRKLYQDLRFTWAKQAIEESVGSDITQVADGLYLFNGVETRRGPQCVEYAERYYVTRYPGTFPLYNSGPGAFDIWEGIAESKSVGGWDTHRQFFNAYANGTVPPQPEDMLLYDRTVGSGWGHVAIIAEVHPGAVVILEQNRDWDTRRILPLVGNEIVDNGVKGVVRLKANDEAAKVDKSEG
ncbi:MAG TPA: CHAP domain-containing protein [Bacilli bacterium]|nr:CHAP domain-containing protein [Bacilli bacterium]